MIIIPCLFSSSPISGEDRGGGIFISPLHPHPNPLPSRERGERTIPVKGEKSMASVNVELASFYSLFLGSNLFPSSPISGEDRGGGIPFTLTPALSRQGRGEKKVLIKGRIFYRPSRVTRHCFSPCKVCGKSYKIEEGKLEEV